MLFIILFHYEQETNFKSLFKDCLFSPSPPSWEWCQFQALYIDSHSVVHIIFTFLCERCLLSYLNSFPLLYSLSNILGRPNLGFSFRIQPFNVLLRTYSLLYYLYITQIYPSLFFFFFTFTFLFTIQLPKNITLFLPLFYFLFYDTVFHSSPSVSFYFMRWFTVFLLLFAFLWCTNTSLFIYNYYFYQKNKNNFYT